MRKFKPIEIKEYRPLTELEMKNVFGGSGESGESGEKCKNPGQMCFVHYSYKDPLKYVGSDIPRPTLPPDKTGTCQTVSGTWTGGSGVPVSGITACDCSIGFTPSYESGEIVASHNCEQK